MQAILIDTFKRPIGSVIVTNGEILKVLDVKEETHWYTHGVWRFREGQIVKWVHTTPRNGGFEMKQYEGTLEKIVGGNATIKRKGKRYNVALYQLFPPDSKPLYDFVKTAVRQ